MTDIRLFLSDRWLLSCVAIASYCLAVAIAMLLGEFAAAAQYNQLHLPSLAKNAERIITLSNAHQGWPQFRSVVSRKHPHHVMQSFFQAKIAER